MPSGRPPTYPFDSLALGETSPSLQLSIAAMDVYNSTSTSAILCSSLSVLAAFKQPMAISSSPGDPNDPRIRTNP